MGVGSCSSGSGRLIVGAGCCRRSAGSPAGPGGAREKWRWRPLVTSRAPAVGSRTAGTRPHRREADKGARLLGGAHRVLPGDDPAGTPCLGVCPAPHPGNGQRHETSPHGSRASARRSCPTSTRSPTASNPTVRRRCRPPCTQRTDRGTAPLAPNGSRDGCTDMPASPSSATAFSCTDRHAARLPTTGQSPSLTDPKDALQSPVTGRCR